ncbi:MAG: sulfite exporter TauE/SafE family protein [Prochloraceae cyanobacterium]
METLITFELIVLLSSLIQGITGFGSALVAMPLFTFIFDIKTVAPLVALMTISVNLFLFVKLKKHYRHQKLIPLLIGAVPGILTGIFFLKYAPEYLLRIIMAIVLLSYSLYALTKPSIKISFPPNFSVLVGFCSGNLGGAFNMNGPPVLLWAAIEKWDKNEFRSILQAYFGISGLIVVTFHAISGLTTTTVLKYFLFAIPATFFGISIGNYFAQRIPQLRFQQMVCGLLILLSILLIIP